MPDETQKHTYRMVSQDEELGNARTEFEALSLGRAINMMQTLCGLHEVELFEDERSLGRMRLAGDRGFWVVSAK
jgi:hypothetical protein